MPDLGPAFTTLQGHYSKGHWEDVLKTAEVIDPACYPAVFFYRTGALFELGQLTEARATVEIGLRHIPASEWGTVLKYNILKGGGETQVALECLRTFIATYPAKASDGVRALLADQAAEAGLYDLAIATNDARSKFSLHPPAKFAVAIQCFAKLGTLERGLEALMQCRHAHDFALVILQDSLHGSAKPERYAEGHAKVRAALAAVLPTLSERLSSITLLQNRKNMGTAASCRRLLDHVADHADGFLFMEDDCILAPDALEWAAYHLEQSIATGAMMIGACEAIFFNARRKKPTQEQIAALTTVARRPDHRWAYTLQDFVPSTCFFTTSEIWREIASVRSLPRGARQLSMYLRDRGGKCIMPVVPRAADIGMMEELGYSVNTLGRDNVAETKNTYLLSLDESVDVERIVPYTGQSGLLFDASVNLNDQAIDSLLSNLP